MSIGSSINESSFWSLNWRHCSITSIFLLLIGISLLQSNKAQEEEANQTKRLVVFAGPRYSASSSVNAFFHHFAAETQDKHEAFADWIWPTCPPEACPLAAAAAATQDDDFKVWNLLVTQADNVDLRKELFGRLEHVWKQSAGNLIVGAEALAEYYPPSSDVHHHDWNAQRIWQRLMERLQPNDLTIVLNIRSPRGDPWIAAWKRSLPETHYKKWLCKRTEEQEHLDLLQTVTHPLRVGTEIRNDLLEWVARKKGIGTGGDDDAPSTTSTPLSTTIRLVFVDMAAIAMAEGDVAHTIACQVLRVPCTDEGWVQGLTGDSFSMGHSDREFGGLNVGEQEHLAQLFAQRDCAYATADERATFAMVPSESSSTVFDHCDVENHLPEYQRLNDDDAAFLQALKSQRHCSKDDVDLDELLVASNSASAPQADPAIQQAEDLEQILKEPDLARKHEADDAIVIPLFLLIAVCCSIYFLYTMNKQVQQQKSRRIMQQMNEMEVLDSCCGSEDDYQDDDDGGLETEIVEFEDDEVI